MRVRVVVARDRERDARVCDGGATPEVLRLADGPEQVHIIVEVDEVLGKPGNPVEVHLERAGREHGQAVLGDKVLVPHPDELLGRGVEPGGELAIGHEEDPVDPRGTALDAPKPVAKKPIVAIAAIRSIDAALLCLGEIAEHALAPLGVGPIDPRDDKVDGMPLLGSPPHTPVRPQAHVRLHRKSFCGRNIACPAIVKGSSPIFGRCSRSRTPRRAAWHCVQLTCGGLGHHRACTWPGRGPARRPRGRAGHPPHHG